MAQVETVTGPIDSADLGRTLVHEHVFVLGEEHRINYQDWDEDARVAQAQRDLQELKELGIDTILDPTVLGLGRYIPRIQQVAAGTDLQIVAATGLYTYNEIPFQFHYTGPGLLFDVPEPLVDLFVRDLTEGIADTGVRAAFLKCAIEEQGLTRGVERVMRAVGEASARTSPRSSSAIRATRPTSTTSCGSRTRARCSVWTGSVSTCSCRSSSASTPWPSSCAGGYTDRVVLAHDAWCFIDWFDAEAKVQAVPKWNFRHISEDVLPALRERGVTEADIETMLVANPRRYFE